MNISLNGLLTHYEKTGTGGKTLLILHGWGHSAAHWEDLIQLLPGDFTTIALDLPAFGQTQPLPGSPGVVEYSDFIRSFIEKLKLKNIFLLGHSFGGQVATDISLRYPKLVKHLILVSPANIRATRPTLKSQFVSTFKPIIYVFPKSVKNYLLKKTASPNYYSSSEIQKKVLNKILYQDYSDKLKNISIPTSVVWGSGDTEIPNKGKFLAENIPVCDLYVLYGSNHTPHLSSPKKLSDTLISIIRKNA